ncbi:MAG: response regulator [Planctomycetaceae bacterium]
MPAPSPTSPESPAASRIRVLLADDHQMVRQGLASLLEHEPDIEVVGEAADGEEAVVLAESLQPDVILMDYNMPKMTGIEATARILRAQPETRIIGLSLYEEREMASAMRSAGAIAYLSKGCSTDELCRAIRAAQPES